MIEEIKWHYPIYLSNNRLDAISSSIKNVYQGKTLYVITDTNVQKLYTNQLKKVLSDFSLVFVTVFPGESSKSLKIYHEVIKALLEKGIKRDHFILAFGGGVIGDLAGFIAATLFRGINYAHIPTTLLSQVDSSIGGKVAVDLDEGKNLLGAFYNPKFVFIDRSFLATLNTRDYRTGIAEIIKVALIKDKDLFDDLLHQKPLDETMLKRALNIKKELVNIDPFDQNERLLLNFGHTFGHAIEKATNYNVYTHGEAISYGMLMALDIGEKLGITPPFIRNVVEKLLIDYKLIQKPLLDKKTYIDALKTDKKYLSTGLKFVLLKDIGEALIVTLKEEDLK